MAFNSRKKTGGASQRVAESPYAIVETHHSEGLGTSLFTPLRPDGNPAISGLLVQAIGDNIRFKLPGDQVATVSTGFQLIASDPPILIPIGAGTQATFFGEGVSAVLEYQWVD